jgi:methylated-DNA-[protein]-cysteine S-methyltransferase
MPILQSTGRWLDLYFSGCKPGFLPQVRLVGTAFQQRVWQALGEIPYGQVATYGDIARSVGCRSAQAVGQAVGRNPVAIIVPCHRVVGSDGSLTGYAYGVERKRYLLQIENKNLL